GYLAGVSERFHREQKWFLFLAGDITIRPNIEIYPRLFKNITTIPSSKHYKDIADATYDVLQFVIIGDPGAGKTTALRYLASAIGRARLDSTALRPSWLENLYPSETRVPLPLWIDL